MKKQEEKGITLVVLVVTIIVLLILAGIVLKKGIINRARNAIKSHESQRH